jgi:predicted Zn-dependent peptidase
MNRGFNTLKRAWLLAALSPCLLVSPASRAAVAPAVSQTLPGGATLITREDKIAPRVSISLLVRAGAADETVSTAGWRQVLAAAILRATKIESGKAQTGAAADAPAGSQGEVASKTIRTLGAWQRWAETHGGQIGATVSDDAIEFWATGDSASSGDFLKALLQIVSSPRLSDSDLAAARRYALEQAGLPARGVARRAAELVARQLFRDAKGTPLAYGLPDFGTFESLSGLTNEQIRAWHGQYFVPVRFTISAAGDADVPALRSTLEKWTAERSAPEKTTPESSTPEKSAPAPETGAAPAETPPDAPPSTPALAAPAVSTPPMPATPAPGDRAPAFAALKPNAPPLSVREMNTEGAWVFVAFRAPAPASLAPEEYAALYVLSAALDGSASARLPRRLLPQSDASASKIASNKEKATQVAAEFSPRRWAGELAVLAQTSTASLDAVKNALLDEVHVLGVTPLSSGELQDAKNFARGRWAANREASHDRAFEAATAALVQPFPDTEWPRRIAAVSATDIQRAAQKYLRAYAVVVILPQDN